MKSKYRYPKITHVSQELVEKSGYL
ncbi:hypothetical protein CP8484711_0618A, partial [Chlamydia psittaci 84-8471/1]